eukprot:TRINITY_DN87_c0_g1_i7.p2 TRINITY_DN87_c0_g1~~TRINITY_DN87_c0_g1_i7.p2  ORF type:complete len:110 (-),score=26.69 TRINITY_DN87_c0_g1_i7:37-366(-)
MTNRLKSHLGIQQAVGAEVIRHHVGLKPEALVAILDGSRSAEHSAIRVETNPQVVIVTLHLPSTDSPVLCVDTCLLYTSDAADEEDSVDLGGRRIIKKKKKKKNLEDGE